MASAKQKAARAKFAAAAKARSKGGKVGKRAASKGGGRSKGGKGKVPASVKSGGY
jgi:hypothetical protein